MLQFDPVYAQYELHTKVNLIQKLKKINMSEISIFENLLVWIGMIIFAV